MTSHCIQIFMWPKLVLATAVAVTIAIAVAVAIRPFVILVSILVAQSLLVTIWAVGVVAVFAPIYILSGRATLSSFAILSSRTVIIFLTILILIAKTILASVWAVGIPAVLAAIAILSPRPILACQSILRCFSVLCCQGRRCQQACHR